MKIKVMVDSGSDLTEKEAKELGIEFVPINVQFGEDEYLDGVNLFVEEFYNRLEKSSEMPKTSLINTFRWGEAFKEATADGSELIVITLSSKLSGTYNAAVEASKDFKNVYVVDSMNATFGEASLAIYAKQLVENGMTAKEIVEKLEEKKKDICVYAVIDTLKYLKKGGRISATSALIGSLLSIKPVIAVIEGEVKVIGKAFGNKKGNLLLNSYIEKDGGIDFDMPFGYIYSGNDKTNLEKYILDCKDIMNDKQVGDHSLGCTIGTHIGPGAVGIVYYKNVK